MRGLGSLLAVGAPLAAAIAGCRFDGPPAAPGDGPDIDAAIDAPPPDVPPGAGRKKRITIDPAKVNGTHAGFPVWIALTDPDLAARAADDGSDLYFTRLDGAPLPHELQRWTKATGRLEAWVRVDLADSAPTPLELRYGDPAGARAPDPPGVFGSPFVAVWHLDDSLATPAVADATAARNGTAMGGLGVADQVAAQLGGGIDFDGLDDQIQFANPFTGNGAHTISAWIYQRVPFGCDSIVTVGTAATNQSRWLHSNFGASIGAGFYTNDWSTGIALPLDTWTLVHWVFDGPNRKSRLYLNGGEVASHTFTPGINTQGAEGYIGYAPFGWGTCALNGTLDEVRLSTTSRNAGWVETEYANQRSPQTFYSVGPEESVP